MLSLATLLFSVFLTVRLTRFAWDWMSGAMTL